MNSPKSRKLFHRGISQSGSLFSPWSEPHRPGLAKERAFKLIKLMDCPTNSTTKEMIECMRTAPASKITGAIPEFMASFLIHFLRNLVQIKDLWHCQ